MELAKVALGRIEGTVSRNDAKFSPCYFAKSQSFRKSVKNRPTAEVLLGSLTCFVLK